MKIRSFKLIFAFLLAVVGFATLMKPQSAAAACGPASSYGVIGGSSGALAGLVVTVKVDGVLTSGINFKVASTDTYNGRATYSVVYTRNGWASSPGAQQSASFSSGSTFYSMGSPCSSTGLVVLGYGTSGSQGNYWTLDCKEVTSPGTGLTDNKRTAHFQLQNISNPASKTGKWSGTGTSTFTASNGKTTSVALNFTSSPPPVVKGSIQGYKVAASGNSYGSTFAAKVSVSGVTSDTSNPFYFSDNVPAGSHTLTAQTPYGGMKAYDIKTSTDAGKTWTDHPGSSTAITTVAGKTVDVRIFYKPDNGTIRGYKVDASWLSLGATFAAKVSVSGVTSDTSNPFYFSDNVPAGTHTLTAGTPYGGMKAYWIKTSTNAGATWTDHSGSSTAITTVAGKTVDVRIFYKPDDRAACGPAPAATTVASGASFNLDLSMVNSGTSTWSMATPYTFMAYFQDGNTSGGTAANNVGSPGSPEIRLLNVLTVGPTGTATFTKALGNGATFTAPATPGIYYVNYVMANKGSIFSSVCSHAVTVRNLFDYHPAISATGPAGAVGIPGGIVNVSTAPQTVTLTALAKNVCLTTVCFAPGDNFNLNVWYYTARYSGGAISSVTAPVKIQATAHAGLAAGGTTTSNVPAISQVIPAGTVDGTQYCYFSDVAPAARTNIATAGYDFADRFSFYGSGATYSNFADTLALHDASKTSRDLCFDVENLRTPTLQVTQGDVHAGGGVAGSTCKTTVDNAAPKGSILGNGNGSIAEFVESASNNIGGIPSGNGSNQLTIPGYALVCRPNLAAVASTYNQPLRTVSGDINVASLATGLYTATGPVRVYGVIKNRVTIYSPSWGVTVMGNITYGGGPYRLDNLPAFGVITGNGNISINKAVTEADGFYVAQGAAPGGIINTCAEHVLNQTNDCQGTLNILGSLTARQFVFGRSGQVGVPNAVGEKIRQSGLLFLAPPPAFETQSNSSYGLPLFGGERVPIY